MNELVSEALALQEELVAWRRHLHQTPELGMELPKTTAFVVEKLEEMGYKPTRMAGGVVALATGKKPGRCILLRADMDALPIAEEAEETFAAKNGRMHACGHDFHTAMLLGAAKLLKRREDALAGSVKLMFQPAEELMIGAKAMLDEGLLEHPKVDAAAMFHVSAMAPYPPGTILVPEAGPCSMAADWFRIDVQGKGGHGALPEDTVDPLLVASHIHLALQAIPSREVSGRELAVVTVGRMQGGETANVIPDTALLQGSIRTKNPEVRAFARSRVCEIAQSVASTFRAKVNDDIITEGCPAVQVDGALSDCLRDCLREALGETAVPDPSTLPAMSLGGSEDFGFLAERVPSVLMMIAAGGPNEGFVYPAHHPKVRFDEGILAQGTAAYALAAMGWLSQNPIA